MTKNLNPDEAKTITNIVEKAGIAERRLSIEADKIIKENDDLEIILAQRKKEEQILNDKIEELKKLETEKQNIISQNETLEERIDILNDEIDEITDAIAQRIELLKIIIDKLSKEKQARKLAEQKRGKIILKMQELSEVLKKLEPSIEDKLVYEELTKKQADTEKKWTTKIAELKVQVSNINNQIKQINDNGVDNVETRKSLILQYQNEISDKDSKIRHYDQNLADLKTEKDDLDCKIQAESELLNKATEAFEKEKQTSKKIEKLISATLIAIDELNQRSSEIKDVMQQKIIEVSKLVEEKKKEIEENGEAQLIQINTKASEKEKELQQTLQQRDTKAEEIKQIEAEIAALAEEKEKEKQEYEAEYQRRTAKVHKISAWLASNPLDS